ncbi:hypothetical protein B0H13DRAFT_1865654 [Mycena leptocephala]|nr:hypothetical protein B0H13DRAFT_1865654 [Mycena leptocephala]
MPPNKDSANWTANPEDRASARCRRHGSTAPVERVPCPFRQPYFCPRRRPLKNGRHGSRDGSSPLGNLTHFFACEREIQLSAGAKRPAIMPPSCLHTTAPPSILSLFDSAPILRGVPVITRGTVDGRPVDRAVPSEVWKYKKRPLPSRQRVEALPEDLTHVLQFLHSQKSHVGQGGNFDKTVFSEAAAYMGKEFPPKKGEQRRQVLLRRNGRQARAVSAEVCKSVLQYWG